MQLLNDLNVGIIEEDVKKIMRLGRFGASESSRPIMIQFGNRNVKNLVMESLYKIKHLDSKFKSVIVTHDLTKKEREECNELVEEAKLKNPTRSFGGLGLSSEGPTGKKMIIQKFRKGDFR